MPGVVDAVMTSLVYNMHEMSYKNDCIDLMHHKVDFGHLLREYPGFFSPMVRGHGGIPILHAWTAPGNARCLEGLYRVVTKSFKINFRSFTASPEKIF